MENPGLEISSDRITIPGSFPFLPARWRVRVCVSFYHESSATSPSGQFPRFHFY